MLFLDKFPFSNCNCLQVSSSMLNAIAKNDDAADTLTSIYRLHALNTIQNNLSDFLLSGMLTISQGDQIRDEYNTLCDHVSTIAPEICDSFGIPEELLSAPIARDWQQFNQYDNRGEIQSGVF